MSNLAPLLVGLVIGLVAGMVLAYVRYQDKIALLVEQLAVSRDERDVVQRELVCIQNQLYSSNKAGAYAAPSKPKARRKYAEVDKADLEYVYQSLGVRPKPVLVPDTPVLGGEIECSEDGICHIMLCPESYTIAEVVAHCCDHPEDIVETLQHERLGKRRKGLIEKLDRMWDDSQP